MWTSESASFLSLKPFLESINSGLTNLLSSLFSFLFTQVSSYYGKFTQRTTSVGRCGMSLHCGKNGRNLPSTNQWILLCFGRSMWRQANNSQGVGYSDGPQVGHMPDDPEQLADTILTVITIKPIDQWKHGSILFGFINRWPVKIKYLPPGLHCLCAVTRPMHPLYG